LLTEDDRGCIVHISFETKFLRRIKSHQTHWITAAFGVMLYREQIFNEKPPIM